MSTAKTLKAKYLAKNIALYSAISAGLLLGAKVIFAQENPRTITMVPPSTEKQLNAGETSEGTLKIINDSNTSLTFTATVKDFIVEDTNGTPVILDNNTLSKKYSAAAWLAVTPNTFTVPAGKSQQINYFMQVPADAGPGGHYAAVVFQPTDIINVKGTGAGVMTQLASLFYIRVNGDITEKAQVIKFGANGFQEYAPIKITTQVQNMSDYHINPKGNIVIKNLFGQVVESQPLTPRNIFPGTSIVFSNTLGKGFMMGRYTATLNATYGTNNNLPLTATTTFIIFPWKVAGMALLVIVAVVLAIIFMRRKKRKVGTVPPPAQTTGAPQV